MRIPGGSEIGGEQSGATEPPRMLMMVAAKSLDGPEVSVHFNVLNGIPTEEDFVMIAAAVLRDLQLHAEKAARSEGREPEQFEQLVRSIVAAFNLSDEI